VSALRGFLLCWSFSTRLGPALRADPKDMGRSIAFFPVVGLGLGLVLVAPFHLGLAVGRPLLQAWIFVALNCFATRGLHWDGWADLADGWGSQAQGARFWEIVKDARVGAFGVIGLVLGLSGQIVLTHEVLASATSSAFSGLSVLVWSCVLGRAGSLLLAYLGRDLSRPGLAQMFVNAVSPGVLCTALGFCLISGLVLVDMGALLLAALLSGLSLAWLLRLARRQQGINGDFLGAALIAGELAAPAGWLLARSVA
jgi:adenosylcobinamide-GDP ribazoletransferase